ncbi:uncharacterized protein LOC126989091 isoform X44 [Eriocheir sinensis]|uniref:uncharacterized protein LOC126989091 isoform X44 n=1 Tax=Eriocheir sinensis TaxID=95602 RepID=UPI0021CAB63D|nr:uncharacterized protein LOC126989091 isoform X44 [Eriocheir sinensis]
MLAALWSAGGPGPRDLIFSSLFFGNTRSINQAKERVFPGCLGRDGRAKEDSRRVGWVEGPTLPLSCSSRLALPSHHWDSRRVGWVEGPTLPLSCSSRLALPSHHWEGLLAMSVALRNTCCPLALKAGLQPEWPGAAEQTVTGVRTKA